MVRMRDMGIGSKEGEDKAPLRSQVNKLCKMQFCPKREIVGRDLSGGWSWYLVGVLGHERLKTQV